MNSSQYKASVTYQSLGNKKKDFDWKRTRCSSNGQGRPSRAITAKYIQQYCTSPISPFVSMAWWGGKGSSNRIWFAGSGGAVLCKKTEKAGQNGRQSKIGTFGERRERKTSCFSNRQKINYRKQLFPSGPTFLSLIILEKKNKNKTWRLFWWIWREKRTFLKVTFLTKTRKWSFHPMLLLLVSESDSNK